MTNHDRLSWNPWKNKKLLEQTALQQQSLRLRQEQMEADRLNRERQHKEQLDRQQKVYEESIRRQQQELSRQSETLRAQQDELRREQQRRRNEEVRIEQEQSAKKAAEQALIAEEFRHKQLLHETETRRRNECERQLKVNNPESLRSLREMIRLRYELDMEIWRLRDVRGPDREVVVDKMERADAVMAEIVAMVSGWETNEVDADGKQLWSPYEWDMAKDIQHRILGNKMEDKRHWRTHPPWDDD